MYKQWFTVYYPPLAMSRIRKAYEAKFRALLQTVGARRLEQGVLWFLKRAQCLSETDQQAPASALTTVYEALEIKLASLQRVPAAPPGKFFCDAGLGGLARWLRAAGYEAFWEPGIDDKILLHKARAVSAVLLTTDSMLMEHGILRDGIIPALWLPPTLTITGQLQTVFRAFRLVVRPPRCTHCGSKLKAADKEALKDRIPPRTYRWLNEFFVCTGCDKLFWHGTHWQKITKVLKELTASAPNLRSQDPLPR